MRILFDECLDQRLAADIEGHDVKTVPAMGWANLKNGQLLTLAQVDFDVFARSIVTCRINKISRITRLLWSYFGSKAIVYGMSVTMAVRHGYRGWRQAPSGSIV
jgi:hypothetical protein